MSIKHSALKVNHLLEVMFPCWLEFPLATENYCVNRNKYSYSARAGESLCDLKSCICKFVLKTNSSRHGLGDTN